MNRLSGVLLTVCLLSAFPPHAYAHPDFPIAEHVLEVPPGGYVAFPLSVHYHRVLGRFEVLSPAAGAVTALVMDDQAFSRYAAGEPSPALYSSRKTDRATVNFLIGCCVQPLERRAGERDRYDPYHLVIDNRESATPATVDLRATLVHDGVAIIAYGGEPFAAAMTAGFFGIFAAILWRFVARRVRGRMTPGRPEKGERRVRTYALGSLTLFAAISALFLAMGLFGIRAYGGGIIEGLAVVVRSDFAGNDILEILPLLGWLVAVALWMKALAAAASRGSRLAGGVGLIEGGGSLLVTVLIAWNYASPWLPMALGAALAGPQLLGGVHLLRRAAFPAAAGAV